MDVANFLIATRDTGYKTTALAIAELVDNSIQAGATKIAVEVSVSNHGEHPIDLSVSDNGAGMDEATLAKALAFGGSTRFDDRSSLGRYGMGLPNGALSRARRIEIYTWRGAVKLTSQLDVDDLTKNRHRTLPPVEAVAYIPFQPSSTSGTVVRLIRCDRLEHRRISTIARNLTDDLGRIYRHFLTNDLSLTVNDATVTAIDPLMLDDTGRAAGARQFGDVLRYRLDTSDGEGCIEVRFSELPIERWHSLSSTKKRQLGITNSPSISILRANREIDRGWFFIGSKRRENYDDWWRCEIAFEPALDELFGITHAKQAINPTQELVKILAEDLEPIGRALNSRVRQRFELLKISTSLSNAEKQAARAEHSLPALPRDNKPPPTELQQALAAFEKSNTDDCPYQLIVAELPSTAAFDTVIARGKLIVALNNRHPFYRDLYGPLAASEARNDQEIATHLALTVLAAARAEWLNPPKANQGTGHHFRQVWSDVMACFFNA